MKLLKLKAVPGESKRELKSRQKEYEDKVRDYAEFLQDDYDFDYSSSLRLLSFKLKRLEDCIRHGNHVGQKETADEIKQVVKLLERVEADQYQQRVFAPFYRKHGQPKMVSEKIDRNMSSMEFLYSNGKPATAKMHKKMRKLYRVADQHRRDDLQKALDIISDKMFSWWD